MKPQISALFNGKNKNAIESISKILDKVDEIEQWGVVELDPRKSFKKDDIMRKAKEQNWTCPFTGVSLKDKIKMLAGDHKIPRSKGIKAGGVTEYHNLIVTTQEINRKKLTMSSEDFSKWCESFKQKELVA
jgi:5-methylcytosine-specific restriction endonuclease McrA